MLDESQEDIPGGRINCNSIWHEHKELSVKANSSYCKPGYLLCGMKCNKCNIEFTIDGKDSTYKVNVEI